MRRINEIDIYQILDHGSTSVLINAVDISDDEQEAIGYYNGLLSEYPLYDSLHSNNTLSLCMIEGIIQTAGILTKIKNDQKPKYKKILFKIENLYYYDEVYDEKNIIFYVKFISMASFLDRFVGEIKSKDKTILQCHLTSGVAIK